MGRNHHLTCRTKHTKGIGLWHGTKQEQSRHRSHKYYQIKGKINKVNKRLSDQQQKKINSQETTIAELRKQLGSTMNEAHRWEYQASQKECHFDERDNDSIGNDSDYTFDGDYDNDSCNTGCSYSKPNNYFKYDTDIILGCIELSASVVSAANMSHVIEVVLKMYKVFEAAKELHPEEAFIPSSSTVLNYIKHYGKKSSDIQSAIEFYDGVFAGSGHTMIRDASSYHGRRMEGVLACTKQPSHDQTKTASQKNRSNFVTRVLALPQIVSGESVAVFDSIYDEISKIDEYSRELFDDFESTDTILNQFSEFMTDGLTGEQCVTDLVGKHQTQSITNTHYKCLQHALNAVCADGLKKYLVSNINKYHDSISNRDIFYLIMILCKLFGKGDYSHNRRDIFKIFCSKTSACGDNKYHQLPKYPTTREMHALKLVLNCINGLSDVAAYLNKHGISWDTEYKSVLGEMITDMNIIRQGLFAAIWYDAFFVYLERYWINSNVVFKEAAKKFVQAHKILNQMNQNQGNNILGYIYSVGVFTVGTDAFGFNTDHSLFNALHANNSEKWPIESSISDNTKITADLLDSVKYVAKLRLCLASAMWFLSDDATISGGNDKSTTIKSIFKILFDNSLTHIQTSVSAQIERLIYDRFGPIYLMQLFENASEMFVESLKLCIVQTNRRTVDLQSNGSLSQEFLSEHENAENVPATSCMVEGTFGQFKTFVSSCKQRQHEQNVGLSSFKRNKTWYFFDKLQCTDSARYIDAIRLLTSVSIRKSNKNATNNKRDISNAMYQRQCDKDADLDAKQKHANERKEKIINMHQITTKNELDNALSSKTHAQKFNICKQQLQIYKEKNKIKICTFTIKTNNNKKRNKSWDELYKFLVDIIVATKKNDKDAESVGDCEFDPNTVYCICRKPWIPGTPMIECGNCFSWYHQKCIKMSNNMYNKYTKQYWDCSKNKAVKLDCFIYCATTTDNDNFNTKTDSDESDSESNDELFVPVNNYISHDSDIKNLLKWTTTNVDGAVDCGAGLRNLGNSCFMNAVLQCLAYTPCFNQYLAQIAIDIPKRCKHHKPRDFCAWREVVMLLPRILTIPTHRHCTPRIMYNNMRKLSNTLRKGRQHDCHEYLQALFQSLKYCQILQQRPLTNFQSMHNDPCNDTTIIDTIFAGTYKQTISCCTCDNVSIQFNPFLDISLEIDNIDFNSLGDCLDNHFNTETLDNGNKYYCNNCNSKQKSIKTVSMYEPPNILVIQLKTFRFDATRSKINKRIEYPITLDVHKYCDWENVANWNHDEFAAEFEILPFQYSLYGAVLHHGDSITSGHYTCNVKTPDNKWYHKDDAKVTEVSKEVVLEKFPYVLFYKLEKQRKNRKMYNYNKAFEKEQVGKHTTFCMGCGEEFDKSDTTAACNNMDCACQYHIHCVDEMDAADGFQCDICEYYSDYE